MPFQTLTGTRFSMQADILRQTDAAGDPIVPDGWETNQDPHTGQIVRVWKKPEVVEHTPDGDSTFQTVPCIIRGIVDGGIRVAGSTERFGLSYENVDFAVMWLPAHIRITKRDRVTNVRTREGIVWRDDEFEKPGETRATVFNVNGVTPLLDAFNRHVESYVLLERAEVHSDA